MRGSPASCPRPGRRRGERTEAENDPTAALENVADILRRLDRVVTRDDFLADPESRKTFTNLQACPRGAQRGAEADAEAQVDDRVDGVGVMDLSSVALYVNSWVANTVVLVSTSIITGRTRSTNAVSVSSVRMHACPSPPTS